MWFQVFLSNTNNFHTVVWFQVFQSNPDNLSYLPNPSARAVYDTRSIFKRSLIGLNSEYSFS